MNRAKPATVRRPSAAAKPSGVGFCLRPGFPGVGSGTVSLGGWAGCDRLREADSLSGHTRGCREAAEDLAGRGRAAARAGAGLSSAVAGRM